MRRRLPPTSSAMHLVLYAGVLLTAAGMALLLAGGLLPALPWGLSPGAMVEAGLLMLILSPLVGVAALALCFLRERDYIHAGVSLAVLLLVAAAIAHGLL